MNNMPMMPSISSQNVVSDESVDSKSSDSFELDTPSHEDMFKKPEIIKAGDTVTEVNVPLIPKKGIEVVAVRKGFYNQQRLKEGDKFFVKSFEKLGEWMKCVDPVIEKKRVEMQKAKK